MPSEPSVEQIAEALARFDDLRPYIDSFSDIDDDVLLLVEAARAHLGCQSSGFTTFAGVHRMRDSGGQDDRSD